VVFLFAPHILLIKNLTGLSWPGLPSQFNRPGGVVTMAAMVMVLVDRINKPVKRFLSTFEDWFTWAATFLPVLTGWLAVQHLLLPYTTMLALHILSVEILLIVLPFTKLFHAFTVFGSRWYNGRVNGHKGCRYENPSDALILEPCRVRRAHRSMLIGARGAPYACL